MSRSRTGLPCQAVSLDSWPTIHATKRPLAENNFSSKKSFEVGGQKGVRGSFGDDLIADGEV